ncbi:MAG: BatA domain-containing protein, partial [Planctomycetaceae bacterium]|nr:BatA domain-containing protein [Planctomycetaceae bacterium]
MSFLNLAFLWGLPLLGVPVAIHLLSRRRQAVVKWGAMQFLMDSSIRRRKIWRLDDLILMLLRVLAVALLVFALARPLWHGSNLAGGSSRDVIFVWDTSLSMDRKLKGGTPFEKMLERTEDLFADLGPTDTLRGMVTVGRGEWLTSEPDSANDKQKQTLLDGLKKTGITEGEADWFACLGTALRVSVPQQARARVVVVLSDGQAHGWRREDQASWLNLIKLPEEAKVPTAIEIYNVIGVTPPAMNLAIDKLNTTRRLIGKGETVTLEADVRNHGYTPVETATIEWKLGEKSIGKSTVGPLGVGQATKATLKHVAGNAGIERLSCRLEVPDELGGDNEQSLILETIDHVPLLLVDDSTEEDPLKTDRGYILAALGQDKSGKPTPSGESIFQVTTISTAELEGRTLSEYRGIMFANTPSLDDAAVSKLTDYVRQGGGVWLALGDRTKPEDFNRQLYRFGGGLAPLPIEPAKGDLERREEFLTIHPPPKEHPATILLSDTQRLDIDRVKVFQRFPFAPAPTRGDVPVLLQSGTGEAMAIEGFLGRGRVIVQGTPMGVRWSNLPLMQAYV